MTTLALPFFAVGNSMWCLILLSLLTAPPFGFVLETQKLSEVPIPPRFFIPAPSL